jgi:hypothetical protein
MFKKGVRRFRYTGHVSKSYSLIGPSAIPTEPGNGTLIIRVRIIMFKIEHVRGPKTFKALKSPVVEGDIKQEIKHQLTRHFVGSSLKSARLPARQKIPSRLAMALPRCPLSSSYN